MFITRWRLGRPRTHIAEKDFVLGKNTELTLRDIYSSFRLVTLTTRFGPPRIVLRPRMGHRPNLHDFNNLLINWPPHMTIVEKCVVHHYFFLENILFLFLNSQYSFFSSLTLLLFSYFIFFFFSQSALSVTSASHLSHLNFIFILLSFSNLFILLLLLLLLYLFTLIIF